MLFGGGGADSLFGGDGADILYAGGTTALEGADQVSGGQGLDTFVYTRLDGALVINDLASGEQLQIHGYTGYHGTFSGADLILTFTGPSGTASGDTITLKNLLPGVLGISSLIFLPDHALPAAPSFAGPTGALASNVTLSADLTIAQDQALDFSYQAYAIAQDGVSLTNTGKLRVVGAFSAGGLGTDGHPTAFTNTATGEIRVLADDGVATGLYALGGAATVTNAGLLQVVSRTEDATGAGGLSGGSVTNSGQLLVWGAASGTGVGFVAAGAFANSGTLTVTGHVAIGVDFRSDGTFSNTGTITIADDTAALDSVAFRVAPTHDAAYDLGGIIHADYALLIVDNAAAHPATADTVNSQGAINGAVSLGGGDDRLTNTNTINGRVDLGQGNDLYDGHGGAQNGGVYGGSGRDTLIGGIDSHGGGNWTDGQSLYGGDGDDVITGSAYNDVIGGGRGSNTLAGGAGVVDILTYQDAVGAVSVDLAAGTTTGAAHDTISGFEMVVGGAYGDTLKGVDGSDTLVGMAGDDTLDGRGAFDILYGGLGDDSLTGGTGNDVFAFAKGDGRDIITDFTAGGAEDMLEIAGYGGSPNFTITQVGADTLIVMSDTDSILLKNVQKSALTTADFQYLTGSLPDFTAQIALLGAAPAAPTADSDFNADGKSDVLWRNDNGEVYVWNSQAGQGAFLGQTLGNPSLGWHVQAVGDYDGDGKADVLWRNTAGDLYVYKSDTGPAVTFTGQSISNADPVWAAVPQSGDFNGDGRADILFRNSATGEVYVWNSQANTGAVNFLGQSLGTVGADWSIKGVGDLNGDGRADVLWRSDAGDVYVWLDSPSGAVSMTGQSVSSVGSDWTLLGLGDFNGDGRDDILWRHTDGELYVWNSQRGSAAVNFVGQTLGVVGLDWTVASIGDYDGDGRADVLFRNTEGRVYLWNSNDTGPVGFQGQGLGQTATDWHILSDFHVF